MKVPGEIKRSSGEENIVPMINVVFLLLIFFLLAGTLTQRPPFDLEPVATTLQPPGEAPENGLYISAGGDLFFQGSAISLDALSVRVASADISSKAALDVIVDRRLTGEKLFPVMEALSKSGLAKIRLVTERSIAQ